MTQQQRDWVVLAQYFRDTMRDAEIELAKPRPAPKEPSKADLTAARNAGIALREDDALDDLDREPYTIAQLNDLNYAYFTRNDLPE